ncbi:MAG: lipocalin family protein [Bdellovibrionota bacterium]
MLHARHTKLFALLSLLVPFSGLTSCSSSDKKLPPLKTVAHVDLGRFMGRWNVIGGILSPLEKGHVAGSDTYSLRSDGDIDVVYEARKETLDGKPTRMTQHAWVVDTKSNAEWKVRPIWPLSFPYLVIDLDADYSYAVIGYPDRSYVWIMARAKSLPETTLAAIFERLRQQGYDTDRIKRQLQPSS